LNGFVSKFYLCLGAMDAGQTAILAIYLISGLLNAAYFFPIVVRAFLSRDLKNEKYGEASAWVVAPLCLTAGLAIAFGIFPDLIAPIFSLAEIIAAEIMQLAPL